MPLNLPLSLKKSAPRLFFALLFLFTILSDQLAKNNILAAKFFFASNDYFEIKTFFNYNLSFLNFIFLPSIIYVLAALFIFAIFYKYIYTPIKIKKETNLLSTGAGFALIAGGALSNLADRLRFGFIIDYFYLKWPLNTVFNIADIAILAGSILLIREIIKKKTF